MTSGDGVSSCGEGDGFDDGHARGGGAEVSAALKLSLALGRSPEGAAALHRAGLASQAEATSRDDGLELRGVYIAAACHCAPPANKPTTAQLERCRSYLVDEIGVLRPPVTLCLGTIGWNAAIAAWREQGATVPRPRPAFGHGAECDLGPTVLLGSYHVSQQNTFTGRLTEPMLDAVLARAGSLVRR